LIEKEKLIDHIPTQMKKKYQNQKENHMKKSRRQKN